MTRWECICDCGNITDAATKHLLSGAIKTCGCGKFVSGSSHPQWTGVGELSGAAWYQIVHNSMQRGRVPVTVTKEYIWNLFVEQGKRCALSGVLIHFGTRTAQHRTASLDRIDSSKGYEPGNVQWVHKDVNKMKNTFDQNYFIEMCSRIAERKAI